MTEDGQASQWVPSGLELDEKANVHRMLHFDILHQSLKTK